MSFKRKDIMYKYWLQVGIYLWETVKVYNIVLYIYEKIFGLCWHDWEKWENLNDLEDREPTKQIRYCKKCKYNQIHIL